MSNLELRISAPTCELARPASKIVSAANPREQKHPIELIQILRGLAATMVVFHHFCSSVAEYHPSPSLLVRSGLGDLGASGVDLFFVISGFIMVLTRKHSADTFSHAVEFWKKRFIRIYPLYWIWTSVLLVLWAASIALQSHRYSASYVISSYLLWPMRGGAGLLHPLLDQGWTLSFEIYFYLFFGLSIALGLRSMQLPFLVGVFGSLAILSRLGGYPHGLGILASDPLILEFLFGTLSATVVLRLRGDHKVDPRIAGSLLAVGFASLLGSIWLKGLVGAGEFSRVILWGCPALLIVTGAALYPRRSLLGRVPALIRLGDASYSIYLTHAFATLAAAMIMKRYAPIRSVPPDLIVLAGSAATVWISFASYPWIEQPLLSRLRRR
jgi:exopolysaccharide production protein ExoZ